MILVQFYSKYWTELDCADTSKLCFIPSHLLFRNNSLSPHKSLRSDRRWRGWIREHCRCLKEQTSIFLPETNVTSSRNQDLDKLKQERMYFCLLYNPQLRLQKEIQFNNHFHNLSSAHLDQIVHEESQTHLVS